MGIESTDVQKLLNEDDAPEALLGSRSKKSLPFPENTEFRVFIGCLDDPGMRAEYEALLTKSYRCQSRLKNPGDLAMITLQGSFDKEGCYHVVSRYAVLPETGAR